MLVGALTDKIADTIKKQSMPPPPSPPPRHPETKLKGALESLFRDGNTYLKKLKKLQYETEHESAPPAPPQAPPPVERVRCWWKKGRVPVSECHGLENLACEESFVPPNTYRDSRWHSRNTTLSNYTEGFTRCAWVGAGSIFEGCYRISHIHCAEDEDEDASPPAPPPDDTSPPHSNALASEQVLLDYVVPCAGLLILLGSCGLLLRTRRRNHQLAREKERLMHERTFALHALHAQQHYSGAGRAGSGSQSASPPGSQAAEENHRCEISLRDADSLRLSLAPLQQHQQQQHSVLSSPSRSAAGDVSASFAHGPVIHPHRVALRCGA